MHKTYATFETERLLLRPTTTDDANFLIELMNSPQWLKFIGDRNVRTIPDAILYVQERMTPQLKQLGYSNYTVIRKEDGAKLGSCGLYNRKGLEGIDIGFAFLPQYHGKGYGLEAASKIKEAAIHTFGITKIKAITLEENTASRKLLEKIGLHFDSYIKLPGDDEELMLYLLEVS